MEPSYEHLQDMVRRLNFQLEKYQEMYPPIDFSKMDHGETLKTPWITDESCMTPLLTEYDSTIGLLNEKIVEYQQQQHELHKQIDKLIAENNRLIREKKEVVQAQLESLDFGSTEPLEGQEDSPLSMMQTQLVMALQEKESAQEMMQAATLECERLETELQDSRQNPRWQSLERQADLIKEQYISTVKTLNGEIANLKDELQKTKTEHQTANILVTDLRRTLEGLRHQLNRKEQEKLSALGKEEKVGGKLGENLKELQSLNTKFDTIQMDHDRIQQDKAAVEKKLLEIQKKCTDLEQREYEAALQVRNSVQTVENAMLEKDQALVRERQVEDENERLKDAIGKLVDEAGARTRQEVDNIKRQCNKNIENLMEEMHCLEMENGEKQAQIERAIREKRAVESELEKLYQEGMVQGTRDKSVYDELNSRACNAERLKDESVIKMSSMEHQLRRVEANYRKDKKNLEAELQQFKDRLTLMNNEYESANEDRLKMLERVDELERKLQKIQQERDAAKRNCSKELACMESDLKMKEAEYEAKFQCLEDSHRHSSLELRQMLAGQQRMSAKWKEECSSITKKFEAKVADLRSDITSHKKRNDELSKLLKESRDKTIETERMLSEYTRHIKKLENRVQRAEDRAMEANVQASKNLQESLHHRHSMFKDSINMQKSQDKSVSGVSSTPDPLALSDLAVNENSTKTVTFDTNKREER